jgi:AcrR family transcriptional regulator
MRGGGFREAKARAIRQRIIAAALDLFIDRGYPATSMDAIADRAGVSAHSLRFAFGTKRALLMEVLGVTMSHEDSEPGFARAVAARDAAEQIQLQTAAAAVDYRRMAGELGVMRAAAAVDPEIAKLWRSYVDQRHRLHGRLAAALVTKAALRPDLTVEMAADISFALLSPEVYTTLVTEQGWRDDQWQEWIANTLIHQLLTDPR